MFLTLIEGRKQARILQRRAFVPRLVGLLLLIASILKGYDLATVPTAETSLWTSCWFLIAVVEAEFTLGFWLISGLLSSFARWTALGVLVVFFFVSVSKALAGETNCGCFGPVRVAPRYAAGLDFIVILFLCYWHPARIVGDAAGTPLFRGVVIMVFCLFVSVLGGIILGVSRPGDIGDRDEIDANRTVVLIEPEKWVGHRCPILPYVDIGDELSCGSWLVVLQHYNCPRCLRLVLEDEAKARATFTDPTAPKIAFLSVPPHSDPLWWFDLQFLLSAGPTERKQELVRTYSGRPAVTRWRSALVARRLSAIRTKQKELAQSRIEELLS